MVYLNMDSLLVPLELSFLLFAAVYAQGTSNVALWKTASQSSNFGQPALRGVDGNVGNNAMESGSCFHTRKEYQPWWRVDLHQDYYITSVVIHNRLDHCCAGRARNIELTIGKSLDSMNQAGYLDGGLTTHTFTVEQPLIGRFVQLQLKGITEFFHLCEVEVMAYPSGTSNVALWKTASQSSNFGQPALRGVDGNVGNNAMESGSCFHTRKEYQPWWRVDLHQDYYITSVVIHNRLDHCCAGRARNIKLTIGKSLDSMSQAGYLDGGLTTTHTFTVDPPLVGRFVQLQLKGITEFFHLCEVEVMAYPSDSDEGNDVNSVDSNKTAVKEFPVNTTVISGIGGVCALVILGAAGILLKRKISNGYCHKADETSERQENCSRTGESSFTVQTMEPSLYEELSLRESKTYTELGNGWQ
ncbi:FUCL6-like protein [Mya arenaria]|uniref:FUCL6-like protein n=1 Tax=Mya arenaria TaxID=6604 RepID=A0ABY7EBW0_MYAAR|nr:FUCL6-like protein [Mya arenaria]